MKLRTRLFLPLLAVHLLLTMTGPIGARAAGEITILLDGRKIESDVAPYVLPKVNVTMVPLRVISEGIGAAVGWSQAAKTVTVTGGSTVVEMTVGRNEAAVNGSAVKLDTPVQVRAGRTMVPLRFVSEQLGLTVGWNQQTKVISLATPAEGPARELRGAWVSTVYNLDWPTAKSYGNSEQQKLEYAAMLDELQAMGMNAVFVQLRPAADAFYPSSLVPWSAYLTGIQGQAPDYDPLAYMIEETHKRGMQFHAWFNPFRAGMSTDTSKLADNHVWLRHPEWIVVSGGKPYINPGVPAARQHIIDTILEVVKGYDVDGVHLDDYFYPSSGTFNDDETFRTYNGAGIADKADWRRDNINRFVKELGEAVHRAKPSVSYGISPFGVWRNVKADPTGSDTSASVSAYDSMYADVRTWIKSGWIDYVAPQVYWSMTFQVARYDKLVDWWANEVKGTGVALYIGHSPYKLGTKEAGWQSAQEIVNQLKYNKRHPQIGGDIFFSAKDLRRNPLGIIEVLKTYYGLS